MCEWTTNCSVDQVWVNSSTWYPIITPESPGLMPTTDSEWAASSGRSKPGKKTLPCHVRNVKELGDSLGSSQTCLPQHIVGIAGGQLTEWHKGPLLSSRGSSYSVHSWHGPMAINRMHMSIIGMLIKTAVVQTKMVDWPLVNMASRMAPENRKHTP